MVQRTGQSGQGNILFVQNNFYYDAFFLKAIGVFFLLPSGLSVSYVAVDSFERGM